MISLARLRLRLTAWYAGSFAAILLLLGIGLYAALSHDRSAELDSRLEEAVAETFRAARIRLAEGHDPQSALTLAVAELDGPDHILYLVRPDGTVLSPDRHVSPEITLAARGTLESGTGRTHFATPGGQEWRMYAARFSEPGVPTYTVVAVADVAATERHYARIAEVLVSFGLAALLPIAIGGFYLARMAAAPAMEQLRRFTADAAHELRTPVAFLRGRTEVALERDREADEYAAALRDVAAEAEHLGTIVDDLFLLARADAGERPAVRDLVYLDDLASDAVHTGSVLARARGVTLRLGRYEEAAVRGDPTLLRRLLMVLIDNAIKFTPEGGAVRVDVHAEGGAPTVVVEDEGSGIATEDLPLIFDRFYRAEGTRTRAEGSGLGLSIARYVADLHGARIGVQSDLGRGSRFTVRFPPASV